MRQQLGHLAHRIVRSGRCADGPSVPFRAAELRAPTARSTGATRPATPRTSGSARSASPTTSSVPGPALAATNHPVQNVAAIPAMAVAIEATSTISIGARVFCVDYRQPVMFAKELATLDFFSRGSARARASAPAGCRASTRRWACTGIGPACASIGSRRPSTLIRAHFGDGEIDVHGQHVHAVGFEGVPEAGHRACRRS